MLTENFIEETNAYASHIIGSIFTKKYTLEDFYNEACKLLDLQKSLLVNYRHYQYSSIFLQTCKALTRAISILMGRIETNTEYKYDCESIEYHSYMSKALTLGESCSTEFLDANIVESLQENIKRIRKKANLFFDNPPSLVVSGTSERVKIGSPYIVVYTFNRPAPCPISIQENGFTTKTIGTPKVDIDKKTTTYTCQFVFQSYDDFKIPIAKVDFFGRTIISPQLKVNLKTHDTPSSPTIFQKPQKDEFTLIKEHWDWIVALVMFIISIPTLSVNNVESWLLFYSSMAFIISRILSFVHAKYPYKARTGETEGFSLRTINGIGIMDFPISFKRRQQNSKEISMNSIITSEVSYIFITFFYLPLIPIGCFSTTLCGSIKYFYKGYKQGMKFHGQDRMHITEILQVYLTCYSLLLYVTALGWFIYSLF